MRRALSALLALIVLTPLHAAVPPPGGGTISIDLHLADGGNRDVTSSFVNAASDALAEHGFTILEDAHAAYVAEITVSRVEVGTGSARIEAGKAAIVPSGGGVVVPLSTGKSRLVPLQRTQLAVHIRRRGETTAVWNGTATTVRAAGTPNGTDDRVAADLTAAVLSAYPAQADGIIGVP